MINHFPAIKEHVEEHEIHDDFDFIKHFILHHDVLLGLARNSFEDLDHLPEPWDKFSFQLLENYKNFWAKRHSNGRYNYLRYSWESGQGFILPGYLKDNAEIRELFPRIAAFNIYSDWFQGGVFKYGRFVNNEVDWGLLRQNNLHQFYDNHISENDWSIFIKTLKDLNSNIKFQKVTKCLIEIAETNSWFDPQMDYFKIKERWLIKFPTELAFPINRVDVNKVYEKIVETKLANLEDRLDTLENASSDVSLVLKDLYEEIASKLNPEFVLLGLEPFPMDKLTLPTTIGKFEEFLDLIVYSRFRNKYKSIVENNSEVTIAKKAELQNLAVVANFMFRSKLFSSRNQAHIFLAKNFKIPMGSSKEINNPSPNTILKEWDKLKESRIKKSIAYKNVIKEFDDDLSV